ncbi:single-stranded DNA exonuclease [Aureimonas ureilytica]|uniref:Single-stranded-DNA-specific exonuclease RecJ n=1 Tax=Aureimonas ureilytica TaxID=401562 RepID=A0A175RG98_9HYPH|nr:single-stranded-DNA-specific exonuclease RecJ [Aureimonas ureilytica]KTR02867.1 single-stranded DNA exonuclease [Aureimonas ureilytica]
MTAEHRTFLQVEQSASRRRWVHALNLRDEASASRIAQLHAIPDMVARVLAARRVGPDEAARFLEPTIRDLMPDPSSLTDMDKAAARLADAIARREKVAIFGDYDVDGAASSALLARYLQHFGLDPIVRIPDRLTEGYGPNPNAMRDLMDGGARLIVTVDCGTGSFEALEAVAARRVDLIVLDHHQTGGLLPPAHAIVNPNRQDDLSQQGHLCAAGVVFVTLAAVSRELRRRGYDPSSLPPLMDDLDLVALATVCDVVPLQGFNRALVVRGLATMRHLRKPGIKALAEIARLSGPIDTFHLGFLLGPRINAGGRIGEAHLGTRLLVTSDDLEARALAEQLNLLNAERQAMERVMLDEAEAEIRTEIGTGEGPSVLIAARANWHPGIVGLLAARLKERFSRPAFAISFDATGRGTGSGRSIPGFDLGRFVRRAVETGILVKGGGHAMAAGLTIERARLGDFRALAEEQAGKVVPDLMAGDVIEIDAAMSASALSSETYSLVEKAGPYGAGHAAPIFALPRHRLIQASYVGTGGHIRMTLKAADGAQASAIAFRVEGTPLGEALMASRDRAIHVAGTLSMDRYGGREKVTMRVVDMAIPSE